MAADPNITYSLVQGGWSGTGNLPDDPLFVSGPEGLYYLSHMVCGQDANSPALNSGTGQAGNTCLNFYECAVCLDELTTRTDEYPDVVTIDMGFHYLESEFYATPAGPPTDTPTPTPTPTSTPTPTPTPTAVIHHVPGDYSTIQAAIDAAGHYDNIIVADGTYTGTGNKNLDFHGKFIKLMSSGGAESCVINCQNNGRGFYFHSDETNASQVVGFTVRNGNVTGDHPSGMGGAVLCRF